MYDLESDKINKPKKVVVDTIISSRFSKNIYFSLNCLGLTFAIYLGFSIENYWFSIIFFTTALFLYIYSKYLKAAPLIGNFLVALLIALSILLLPILEMNSAYNDFNYYFTYSVIYIVSFFAFCLNFIRELVKDIERVLTLQTKDDELTPSPRAKEYLKRCLELVKGK